METREKSSEFYKNIVNNVFFIYQYGTPEVIQENTFKTSYKGISNVTDMFHTLKTYMTKENGEFALEQGKITATDLGTMDIWLDRSRPMTFTGDLKSGERDRLPSF